MAKTASIRLTDHFERFVAERTASGRYASVDEVIEAGLALLEQEADLDALGLGPASGWTPGTLAEAIREGEESGIAEAFDIEDLFAEVETAIAAEPRRTA